MKSAVWILLFIIGTLLVPSWAISCRNDPERCNDGQCCVEFGIFGRCRPLLKEGDQCELKSINSKADKHVYLMRCPCGEGLTCKEDDSGSHIQGTCVQE